MSVMGLMMVTFSKHIIYFKDNTPTVVTYMESYDYQFVRIYICFI